MPRITIIIPTHNRRDALLRLLIRLEAQQHPAQPIEVIVIADGCTDDTVSVLGSRAHGLPLRVIEQNPAGGPGKARNLGAAHASGDVLLFIDDDIEPFQTLLETHTNLHACNPELTVIGAPVPQRNEGADFQRIAAWAWWEQQFERMSRPGHRFLYSDFFTGILSISTVLYQRVGGFDDFFAECHEDYELGLRLLKSGAPVIFSRDGGGVHHEVRNLRQLLERKRAEGKADVRLAKCYPELKPVLQLLTAAPAWPSIEVVRFAAVSMPFFGALVLLLAPAGLTLLETVRARRWWTYLQGAALYYAYRQGAATEAGGSKGLQEIGSSTDLRQGHAVSEIDLAHGLQIAQRQLDVERPDALLVRSNGTMIGELPLVPGAERLRGVHLREILQSELSGALLSRLGPSLLVR